MYPLERERPGSATTVLSTLDLGLSRADHLAYTREQVASDDEGKWDAFAWRHELRLYDGQLSVPNGDLGTRHLSPNSWAVTQFCQKLAIPVPYFKRCTQSLQSVQFNHWIRENLPDADEVATSSTCEPVRWLLRAKGDTLRGVLSDRYARLDNAALLDCIAPALSERFEVKWAAITEESFHLRLVDPAVGRDVVKNDRLLAGIHIANSEVGRRSVTIDALVYRLVCTNGMIRLVNGKSLLARRHISLSEPRFAEAARIAIGEAAAASAAFIEQLRMSVHIPIGDPEAAIVELASEGSLSQATQERMKQALVKERPEHQETVYGLVNAATEAAQSLSPDERYDVEVLAGRMVERAFASDRRSGALLAA